MEEKNIDMKNLNNAFFPVNKSAKRVDKIDSEKFMSSKNLRKFSIVIFR